MIAIIKIKIIEYLMHTSIQKSNSEKYLSTLPYFT